VNTKNKETSPVDLTAYSVLYFAALQKYLFSFSEPFFQAGSILSRMEMEKAGKSNCTENLKDFYKLFMFNLKIAENGFKANLKSLFNYHFGLFKEIIACGSFEKELELLNSLISDYPEAIEKIKENFGFHFNNGLYRKIAETERFICYQVLPTDQSKAVENGKKPILVIPPYVLGPDILAFLPAEKKSFVHAFANEGIPTYVRIVKDIDSSYAVRKMTGEDDVSDTAVFLNIIKERHDKMVTLSGMCQGGFIALLNMLSGRLDRIADTLILCVAPVDGTKSRGLTDYLEMVPKRFREPGYAIKKYADGTGVVDGSVMSLVYKLKSIENEAPFVSFLRDYGMVKKMVADGEINRTAAGVNCWILNGIRDLPVAITRLSFYSYTIPIRADGTLPVSLFGKKLNLKHITRKGMKILICYAAQDDLVSTESALAPLDYIDAETCRFPKGHAAIATTWSHPESEFSLSRRFNDGSRGPVRFHLDVDNLSG
jgi:hypothetical protein